MAKALNEIPLPILARGVASPNLIQKDRTGTHYTTTALIQHHALRGTRYIQPTSKRRI